MHKKMLCKDYKRYTNISPTENTMNIYIYTLNTIFNLVYILSHIHINTYIYIKTTTFHCVHSLQKQKRFQFFRKISSYHLPASIVYDGVS